MSFNSTQFLFFFPVVTIIYFAIPYKIRWLWLLIASYYFYMSWDPKYVILIFMSTLITYIGGMLIEKTDRIQDAKLSARIRKLLVFISISGSLSILFLFKYYNFFSNTLIRLFSYFHIAISMPSFDFLLPIGISFYTLQALSYIIDVYRKDVKAEKNLGKYALFISFFPQLLSGPIQKSKDFLPQINERHYFNYDRVKNGLLLMLWGYFQKFMVADRLGEFVNTVYSNPTKYKGFVIILATIFFAFQLYCDFSSYSNIAIGAAEVMGFKLCKNFERPYFSKSIKEFWRRWHISLGSWFKDYLYFPLGGSKCSKLKTYFNIMVVFIVSGLWHGAALKFLVWGFLHGIYQILGNVFKPIKEKVVKILNIRTNAFGYKLSQVLINFILVDFAWIFFRASSLSSALMLIKNMIYLEPLTFINGSFFKLGLTPLNFLMAMLSLGVVLCVDLLQRKVNLRDKLFKQNTVFRWSIYLAAVLAIVIFGTYGADYNPQQFIYAQF